jgi:hypothetical protein
MVNKNLTSETAPTLSNPSSTGRIIDFHPLCKPVTSLPKDEPRTLFAMDLCTAIGERCGHVTSLTQAVYAVKRINSPWGR